MFQSVFRPLQPDIRFLLYPLPALPSPRLTVRFPTGSNTGLPCSTCMTRMV